MGDVLPKEPLPPEIDATKLKAAVDAAFEPPEALTAAFVVTWKGRLIAERYGDGVGPHTPLEGWSMGKSITATLFGILLNKGMYELTQPAPIPEWQTPGDPRAKIRIEDLLHMSSGLRIRRPKTPTTIHPVPIRIMCICTREASIPTIMRQRVRSSGRLTRSAVTTTPIRS
jgi:CubicO group peptidase (beta-lactamase class C family)